MIDARSGLVWRKHNNNEIQLWEKRNNLDAEENLAQTD
jgi:hypothetical protein